MDTKKVLRAAGLSLALTLGAFAAGCTNETTTTSGTNTARTATPAPTAAATPAANGNATAPNNLPVTLPVLDALFADEQFAGELKSKLQLTDDQVEKLRAAAREETSGLRESEDDHGGRTTEATARADERIRSIVGPEKAQQLASFVRERWSTGGEAGAGAGSAAALPSQPNSVPTDTRVVVNAPAYRMDVFEQGRLVKSYRVGIGYPEFPLPTGMRRATSVIFNPTWTPPDEPWVEAPSSKVKVGETVPAGSKLNPLGPIKIPIGLPLLIHGGKSPARLGSFASHGCVGLTDKQVQEFAPVLARLGGANITPEDVSNYAKQKTETKNVKLERPVPVELRYETIVVSDGKLYIYRDVYDQGTNTEENLRAVLQAHGVSLEQLSEPERAQVMKALQEMARDAKGNPADGQPTPTPAADNKNKNANNKNANAGGERVTRAVKGRKEVVIEIAALRGKGYPAPVELNTGGAPEPKQKAAGATRKRA